MPVHIFLDWSGTLCDDAVYSRTVTNFVIRSLGGREATPEEFRRNSNLTPRTYLVSRIPSENYPAPERLEELFEEAIKLLPLPSIFPGAKEFIECARQHGGTVSIFSGFPQNLLERAIDVLGLRDFVDHVHGGIDDRCDSLPRLIADSGLSPDDCLVLGDRIQDVQAARAARVRACVVLHGCGTEKELRSERPDEIWRDLHEARSWLERHLMLETRSWPIATVGGLVFREDGKAFFVRTAKWSGRWGTPGGKIDYGERHLDAFVREIREETGIETVDPELVLVQDAIEEPEFVRPRHFLLLNLVGRVAPKTDSVSSDATRLNHESIDGGWFSLQEARSLELNRPTRVLVEFLLSRDSADGRSSSRSS